MTTPEPLDEPRREKENMDEPQEEFVQDEPPSKGTPAEEERKDSD